MYVHFTDRGVTGVPTEFWLFAIVLLGVAVAHRRALEVAVAGLLAIAAYRVAFGSFGDRGVGFEGLIAHLEHEWVIVANLGCLLLGFALLSRHFEKSHLPLTLPRLLPDDWRGPLVLLVIVFVLSAFLDNIAGALIGGAMAHSLFKKLHIGYLAALVAAANAGGAGSVVGDTTTTMMWIDGVSPLAVLPAYIAALTALLVFGVPASRQQQSYSPIVKDVKATPKIDWMRVGIVLAILVAAISANVIVNLNWRAYADSFPFVGVSVWLIILASTPVRRPDWEVLGEAGRGAIFLLSLVLAASMMPVEQLPQPTWYSALGMGFISAAFDNIPLTKLALDQGGYDWGILAYCVGFGGSMTWFGSSAGVAIANLFPQARSVGGWLRHGWYVPVAYVVGFFVLLALMGWNPQPIRQRSGQGVHVSDSGLTQPIARFVRQTPRAFGQRLALYRPAGCVSDTARLCANAS